MEAKIEEISSQANDLFDTLIGTDYTPVDHNTVHEKRDRVLQLVDDLERHIRELGIGNMHVPPEDEEEEDTEDTKMSDATGDKVKELTDSINVKANELSDINTNAEAAIRIFNAAMKNKSH